MSDHLSTYLNDHLAGAETAIEMLERLRDAYPSGQLGAFAEELRAEIEEDRTILKRLASEIGDRQPIKEAAAWLAEKAARLKLRLGTDADLAVFESMEALSLGILGKRALWAALQQIADHEPRLAGIDFPKLIARAEDQHARVENLRLQLAQKTLVGSK